MSNYEIRPIRADDNQGLAELIRSVMQEFGADQKEGTIYSDPVLDRMYEQYQVPGAKYWVAYESGKILGGAGIRQLDGTNEAVCELQRMFLAPQARGRGIGAVLMGKCLAFAQAQKYKGCYLETMPTMKSAQHLYKKSGFRTMSQAMGHTGHFACQVYMYKDFEEEVKPVP